MSERDPRREREAEATVAHAEAEAPKAQGADGTEPDPRGEREAEATVAKAEAEAAKAQADARAAEAAAKKAEQEVADHDAPAVERQREAEAQKKAAEAAKDAAAARREQVAALIPDLGSVKESTLEVKEGPPLWGSFLLGRAVEACAKVVAGRIKPSGDQSWRILVTSDPDLASADATHQDVKTGLEELVTAADKLLEETKQAVEVAGFTPGDVVGAIVGAVPAVLSLLSAKRTLSTTALTASDLAAVAAVAGSLKATTPTLTIVKDDFRLVPGGGVYARAEAVATKRQQLVARKIQLSEKRGDVESGLTRAQSEIARLKKVKDLKPDQERALEEALKSEHAQKQALSEIGLRLGLIDSLLTAIDSFTGAIRAVPSSGGRSALASAALHEGLHGDTPYFSHVLLVKTQPGQAQQVLDNRPLWMRDRYSTAVDVSITYVLIDVTTSEIVAAGTDASVLSAQGRIGDRPTLEES